LSQLELERVLLMPTGEAPHREIEGDPGRETRYELCRLAVLENEEIEVSRLEIDRKGPSYTFETLETLRAQQPQTEFVFIVGADQAEHLPEWREPERVLELATVAVADRDGVTRERVKAAVRGLQGADRIVFFDMPRVDISSTMVRERAARRKPFRHLVPEQVGQRIDRVGLYRADVREGVD
jgi:nicotinate-nucleotide adenylyltransferase